MGYCYLLFLWSTALDSLVSLIYTLNLMIDVIENNAGFHEFTIVAHVWSEWKSALD